MDEYTELMIQVISLRGVYKSFFGTSLRGGARAVNFELISAGWKQDTFIRFDYSIFHRIFTKVAAFHFILCYFY